MGRVLHSASQHTRCVHPCLLLNLSGRGAGGGASCREHCRALPLPATGSLCGLTENPGVSKLRGEGQWAAWGSRELAGVFKGKIGLFAVSSLRTTVPLSNERFGSGGKDAPGCWPASRSAEEQV